MSKEQIDKDDREKRLNETAKLHLSRIKDFINQFDPKSPSDVLMVQLLNYCFITVSNELHKNMIQISKGINSGSDEAGKSIIKAMTAGVEKFAKLYSKAHEFYEM